MMDDRRSAGQAEAAGLCHHCRHMDVVRSNRGAVFYMCRLSFSDPTFPRYPAIPVVACAGFERQPHDSVHGDQATTADADTKKRSREEE